MIIALTEIETATTRPQLLSPRRPLPYQNFGNATTLSLRESPHPNAQKGGNDKRDPAYAHWNRMGPESDLGMIDQSQDVTKSKDGENDTRDA
jgi:hypothetical protein